MYFLFEDECEKQIEDLETNMNMLRSLIQEHSSEDEKWQNGYVPLLCDQYSTMNQLCGFLTEVCTSPVSEIKKKSGDNKVKLSVDQMAMLESYSMLLLTNDFDLRYAHRTYLMLH